MIEVETWQSPYIHDRRTENRPAPTRRNFLLSSLHRKITSDVLLLTLAIFCHSDMMLKGKHLDQSISSGVLDPIRKGAEYNLSSSTSQQ